MPSVRFRDLEDRIKELRRLLLPSRFDPTGTYKDALRVTTRALSFRVLSHAEVETYLEDRALEVGATALNAWEAHKHVSAVTFHLIGFGGRTTDLPPDTLHTTDQNKLKDWNNRIAIDDRFSKCVSDFNKRIRLDNHGVKERNILDMFIPIGFNMSKCSTGFLDVMNNFGEARGLVAHTSGKNHVQKAIDPKDEYTTLETIMSYLRDIDVEFDALLETSSPPASGPAAVLTAPPTNDL